MSSNLQQWNPGQANQETDAQYLVDAQRLAGAANPSIWTSQTANKFLYQCSTVLCALGDALSAKGLAISDASRATLAGVLANIVLQSDLASALALYAPLVSPALDGAPTTTTPAVADNSTRIADTAWVRSQGYLASITAAMVLSALGFTPVQQGGGAGQSANKVFIGWDAAGGRLRAQVDATDFGDIAWESDLASYLPVNNPVVGGQMNITGSAIIPAPSAADNSTRVPNTAWVQALLATDFACSLGANGWQRLASGLIIQWGNITAQQQVLTTFNFPRAFTAACYVLLCSKGSGITAAGEYVVGADVISASQFNVLNTGPTSAVQGVHFLAIGA